MTDYRSIEQRLTDPLGLRRRPVAVTCRRSRSTHQLAGFMTDGSRQQSGGASCSKGSS